MVQLTQDGRNALLLFKKAHNETASYPYRGIVQILVDFGYIEQVDKNKTLTNSAYNFYRFKLTKTGKDYLKRF